ncbi:MAG: peptide-methionine (S)-S-oxide reductase MsrA [Chitinophagaceae bacterium]|jgi:peptide-methionine (S)-S-oxide reductase
MIRQLLISTFILLQVAACGQQSSIEKSTTFKKMNENNKDSSTHIATATFGAGCFWCTEAQFLQLKGVSKVVSGYMGGTVDNPSYKEVCTGSTGHAEVTNVSYDPAVISFDELLAAFFVSHDPTQLNRQGNDIGTQYRSVVFYHDEEQRAKANGYIKKLNEEKVYPSNIVTEVSPATTFYVAEDYHQNYYNQNGSEPYCHFVIQPKVEKFKKVFKDKLK